MANSEKSGGAAAKGLKAAIVPVTPFQQNCTLIWDPETMQGAVVDPGGDLDRIEAAIAEVGMKPEKILLTHGHIDHAGGAAEMRERLGGIPIEGPHEAERPLLDNLDKQGAAYGMEARPVTPDRWLADGDTVTVAGHTFEVLHCPGHSPGSVVLANRAQRFALMGDVLFQGSIGRTDLPMGSHEALMHSIRTKVLPLGDEFAFICGHGPTSTIGQERRTNPFIVGDAA
ncbi:MAG: MBL fold metallo-hydrolase [Hyphomicrobium sp.]|jgi:glyoxylase-like metal-dependent hydrolase (beta-lactamase superfamily II)